MDSNRVLKNASWIIGFKVAQSIVSFLVSVYTARFLGPSNYGLINYAMSIVNFVIPLAQLGLGTIQVQELVNHPEEEGSVTGTTLILNAISSLLCIFGIFVFVRFVNANEQETIIVCILYSIILLFEGAELMPYWFQAHYISKYSSLTSFVAFLIISIYRIILLVRMASIYWFAVANAVDYFIVLFTLLGFYKIYGRQKLSFSTKIAKRMIDKSKYYILANMMVTIFTQTDRVMLKLMLNDSATGYYSVAASFANLANFVYVAIIDSLRPAIFETKKKSIMQYEKSLTAMYSVIIYSTLLVSLIIAVLSPIVIRFSYGNEYYPAVGVLQILVWYTTGSFLGSARNVWILAEGKQRYIWRVNVIGAISNVIMNFVLIPAMGAIGAALASVVTQFLTNVVSTYLIRELRPSTRYMKRGLNPKIILGIIIKAFYGRLRND